MTAKTKPATCACGEHVAQTPAPGVGPFPANHGSLSCYLEGRHLSRDYFQMPAREFARALAKERASVAQLAVEAEDTKRSLTIARDELRRLEAALERWRTLALAQACVLAEDLRP